MVLSRVRHRLLLPDTMAALLLHAEARGERVAGVEGESDGAVEPCRACPHIGRNPLALCRGHLSRGRPEREASGPRRMPSHFPFSGSRKAARSRTVVPGGGVRSVRELLGYSLRAASPALSNDAGSTPGSAPMSSSFTNSSAACSSIAARGANRRGPHRRWILTVGE